MNENILAGLVSANPSADQQAKTLVYFDELKNSEYGWQVCLEALNSHKYDNAQIQFFCFQVLEHHVKVRYSTSSLDHQNVIRKFILQWLHVSKNFSEATNTSFLRNKIAQIVSLVFVQDYPSKWPSFFNDLLATLQFGEDAIDHYLRILLAIDSEVADQFLERSNQESQRNTLIKDTMREKNIAQLVNSWYQILTTYERLNPNVANLCLQVIGKYILWIDIGLVANDNFVPVLVKQLSESELREAAAECIHDIINKGMDPVVKIKLVESFDNVLTNGLVWQAFSVEGDPDYLCKLGKLCSCMGENLLDCYWKLAKSNEDGMKEICRNLLVILQENYNSLTLTIMANEFDDVSLTVLEFERHYLHLLKSKDSLTAMDWKYMEALMGVVVEKLKFDDSYDYENPKEDEAIFDGYRKQLKTIFENMLALNHNFVLDFVLKTVKHNLENWRSLNYQCAEVALTLMYFLGEDVKVSGCNQFCVDLDASSQAQQMVLILMQSSLQYHGHSAVVLRYFDIVVRYVNFFQVHTQYINSVLDAFLKTGGIYHRDKKVRSRCAYLLCRFIKCVRGNLTSELTEEILICIQPLLELATPANNQNERLLSNDDQLYLYEIAGMVIVSGERIASKKGDLMRRAVGPLLQTCKIIAEQLDLDRGKDTEKSKQLSEVMIQAISVTGRISKVFSGLNNMKNCCCDSIFAEALQTFIESLDRVPNIDELPNMQSALRQYFHRMVVCLEVGVLPYFTAATISLLRNCDSRAFQEYIPLLVQVITKFKLSWQFQRDVLPHLRQSFGSIVRSIYALLILPLESNDLQAVRDRQMLQRQYYNYIAAIVTNNLTEVVSNQSSELIHQIMLSIIQGGVNFPDPVAQKSCFSILKKFVEVWGTNGPEGFIDFMYRNIIPACFMAPMKATFDLTDAQSLLALNEIALCLKTMFDKRGEEFMVYMQGHYLPTLEISEAKILELIGVIRVTNIKYLKLFLKTFFLGMRAPSS